MTSPREERSDAQAPRGGRAPSGTNRSAAAREQDDLSAALLRRGSAEEVLSAISYADPLGLYDRCARGLQSQAYLLDSERLRERSLAHIALAASGAPESDLSGWIGARVSDAIQDILTKDAAESSRSVRRRDDVDPRHDFLIGGPRRRAGQDPRGFRGLQPPESPPPSGLLRLGSGGTPASVNA